MTPVLMAVCLLTGFALGWFTKRQRLGLLAENNHWLGEDIEALKGADLDADVAAERRMRLSSEQPAVAKPVELYDQDADPWDFIGIRVEGSPPIRMTGERDTDAQDRELTEVYGIEHDIVLDRPERPAVTLDGTVRVVHPEGVCPRCGENLTVLDDGALWCAECTSFWDRPCGWSADGADGVCGEPSEGHASWPGQDEVPLCGVHLAWMSENQGCPWAECPHPDRCDTGCRWGEEANRWAEVIHADDGESLPRVLPEGRID